MKAVKVLWVDSCNSNMNWTFTEDIEVEPMYINSFGVVVKDTDEFLAIAQNYGDNPEQYSNITTIPKGCIKEVFVIHEDNVYENEQKPTQETKPFEAEHGKYYYCIKDYFCGGRKQASKGDVVQALRGLPIMGLKDASEYFLPVNYIKCNSAWGGEDENILKLSLENLTELKDRFGERYGKVGDCISWLQSLKDRYTWKPSDEQMGAFKMVFDWYNKNFPKFKALDSLYNDLNKLKG